MKILYFVIIYITFSNIYIFGNNPVENSGHLISLNMSKDSIIYSVRESDILKGEIINFAFPSYTPNEKRCDWGIKAEKESNHVDIKASIDKYDKNSQYEIHINTYVEKIDTIHIYIKDEYNKDIKYKAIVPEEGYTFLPTIKLPFSFSEEKVINKRIRLHITGGTKQNKSGVFIVGRVNLVKKIKHNIEFYNTISHQDLHNFRKMSPATLNSDILYGHSELPDNIGDFDFTPSLKIHNCNTSTDSILYVHSFIDKIIGSFQFYKPGQKEEVSAKHKLIAHNAQSLLDYYTKTSELVNSLNNPHYFLHNGDYYCDGNECGRDQPLFFHKIQNMIEVSAVFDVELSNTINPGDKLIRINNMPPDSVYSIISSKISASNDLHREYKITQKLLYYALSYIGDTLSLELQNSKNRIYNHQIDKSIYSRPAKKPANFRITPPYSSEMHDDILYLRLRLRQDKLLPFVYSQLADLQKSKGLVIDLRSANGSDNSILNLFSLFIDKTTPIFHEPIVDLDISQDNFYYCTHIIKASKDIYYNKPIVFLIDARTFCGPELFINAIKTVNKSVFVVGVENSAGGAQLSQTFLLPKGAFIYYFQGRMKDKNGEVIDLGTGISPDIYVNIQSYQDLAPYNDKVKDFSLKFLKEYAK